MTLTTPEKKTRVYVECHTQVQMEAALAAGDIPQLRGDGEFEVRDQSTVHAGGQSTVHAGGQSTVHAGGQVAIHQHSDKAQIEGGVVIAVRHPRTAAEWCGDRAVAVQNGVAALYKAVRDDYRSAHGLLYTPGSTPEAPDWDGGERECGGGLHFCATIDEAMSFDAEATRFLACPVALADIRAPKREDDHPHKVKARRCCAPIYEVDQNGKPLAGQPAAHAGSHRARR